MLTKAEQDKLRESFLEQATSFECVMLNNAVYLDKTDEKMTSYAGALAAYLRFSAKIIDNAKYVFLSDTAVEGSRVFFENTKKKLYHLVRMNPDVLNDKALCRTVADMTKEASLRDYPFHTYCGPNGREILNFLTQPAKSQVGKKLLHHNQKFSFSDRCPVLER